MKCGDVIVERLEDQNIHDIRLNTRSMMVSLHSRLLVDQCQITLRFYGKTFVTPPIFFAALTRHLATILLSSRKNFFIDIRWK